MYNTTNSNNRFDQITKFISFYYFNEKSRETFNYESYAST